MYTHLHTYSYNQSVLKKGVQDTDLVNCCCCCWVASVMSDSVRPHRWQPTRLLCPWDSPGKNTGVGCHFSSNAWKWKVKVKLLSRVRLLVNAWTAAYQAPPSNDSLSFRNRKEMGLDGDRMTSQTSSFVLVITQNISLIHKSFKFC